jgi:hypothetical protein
MYPDSMSLTAASLFEIGESICSEHPELVQRALTESDVIERQGVRGYAREQDISIDACLHRLIDGLCLRFFTAVQT